MADESSQAERDLVAGREARLAEMRALTMAERLSRFQRLCVEAGKIKPVSNRLER